MGTIKKAIAAAIVACGTGLTVIATSDAEIGTKSVLVVVGGTLVAFGATWKVTNDAS